ncbi:unnamed protein product, partial [Rotaria magnacalcarata]
RTLEDLADFDFTVRWIPGNTNVIADALSRVNDNDTILEENARSDMQVDPVGSKLTEVKMEGGGDSLVKCFSLWLHGNENEHLAIRECIVKELFENQKKYGLELNKAEKFKLRILKQAGMLLIPEAVAAFANLYKCEVVLFENRRNPLYFGKKGDRKCFLNGCHNIHYNFLVDKIEVSVAPCVEGGREVPIAFNNVAIETKINTTIVKPENVVVPLCLKPYVDNNNVVHKKIVPMFLRKVEHNANINTVPLFLRGADKSNSLVNNKIIPLFLREPGKPGKVINTVNMQSNEIPLTLANVAFNNKLTKIIYGRWSHKQAQLIQKENDQIRALRKVIAAFTPGLQR